MMHTVTGINNRSRKIRPLAFENNGLFIYQLQFKNNDNKLIDNAEDLDVAMPMYNLIEYSKNYRQKAVYGIIIEMN